MSLKVNVLANFSGSVWSALMSLAFVPLYIQLMGVESFGVVGVYTSLMAIFTVLDLGLSQVMNREMARLSGGGKDKQRISNTARTLEVVYWGVALLIAAAVFLLASPIANYWLKPNSLTQDDLKSVFQIIGLVLGLRWPVALYMGGLNGLQRQVLVNVLLIIVVTLQGVGALVVLWFIEPTIHAFFIWQAIVTFVQVIMFRTALWYCLPSKKEIRFDKRILLDTWRFAAGMSAISLLTTVLTQLDKLVLSKMLSLTQFGYYTFAAAVAGVIFKLIGPVFTAYYPRLTQLAENGEHSDLVNVYHQGSQVMALAVLPVGAVLIFFSQEILALWTQNSSLVGHTALLVSLLTIGNVLNGIMHLPYSLQLAHGWTSLSLIQNAVAVVVLVPMIYFSTLYWGAIGAAITWISLNMAYLLIGNHVMHRRLLKGEKWQWYIDDLAKPLVSVIVVCFLVNVMIVDGASDLLKIGWLFLALTVSICAALISSRLLRTLSRHYLIRVLNR